MTEEADQGGDRLPGLLAEDLLDLGPVRLTGTMEGEFMGMPPTGKTTSWTEVHIGRMAGGKVVEHWAVIDALAMVQQAGFILTPAPEPES